MAAAQMLSPGSDGQAVCSARGRTRQAGVRARICRLQSAERACARCRRWNVHDSKRARGHLLHGRQVRRQAPDLDGEVGGRRPPQLPPLVAAAADDEPAALQNLDAPPVAVQHAERQPLNPAPPLAIRGAGCAAAPRHAAQTCSGAAAGQASGCCSILRLYHSQSCSPCRGDTDVLHACIARIPSR